MNIPSNLRYSKDHEWVRAEGDAAGDSVTIGITEYAQDALGDVVFVELPELGKKLDKGAEAAVVESVKAASEIYAPVAGEVVAVNYSLTDEPGRVNTSPENEGWFLRMKIGDRSALDSLMDADAYQAFLETI